MEHQKYKIIYADPPWKYVKLNCYEKKGVNNKVYDRMEIEDICNLDVESIADKDSLLFLWTTAPFLQKAFRVIESWGFKFVTIAFVWIKTYSNGNAITGMGRYTRSATEFVLLARKGKGVIREDTNVHQLIYSNLSKHSEKPKEIRDRIVNLVGDVPRIELFSREKVKGWDCFGNEVDSDVQLIAKSKTQGATPSLNISLKETGSFPNSDFVRTSLNNNIRRNF